MKLNIDSGRLRLRLSEAELELLLAHGHIDQTWSCPDGTTSHCTLTLEAAISSSHCQGNLMQLDVTLPREPFAAFAAERPRRDGFTFSQGAIRIGVEVDVRDSHRRRSGPTEAALQPARHPSTIIDGGDPTPV